MLTPLPDDASISAVHSMMAPSAPRKSTAKPVHLQANSQLTEDIEDSFQDDHEDSTNAKPVPTSYHQQSLQLKRGGANGGQPLQSDKEVITCAIAPILRGTIFIVGF